MNRVTHSRHPDHTTSQTRALCGWLHRPRFTQTPEDEPTCQKCQKLRSKHRLVRIELTYRAQFRFPKQGPLNPAGFKVAVPIKVEVYRSRKKKPVEWDSRNTDTQQSFGLAHYWTPEEAQETIAQQFEQQISDWRIFSEGTETEVACITITPDGKTYRKIPRNIAIPTMPKPQKAKP